jgi:hypothetical protein
MEAVVFGVFRVELPAVAEELVAQAKQLQAV